MTFWPILPWDLDRVVPMRMKFAPFLSDDQDAFLWSSAEYPCMFTASPVFSLNRGAQTAKVKLVSCLGRDLALAVPGVSRLCMWKATLAWSAACWSC